MRLLPKYGRTFPFNELSQGRIFRVGPAVAGFSVARMGGTCHGFGKVAKLGTTSARPDTLTCLGESRPRIACDE